MQSIREMSPADDAGMLRLWRDGHDTIVIAEKLNLQEWQVYNRLLHVREAAR